MKIEVPSQGCACGREHPKAHGDIMIGGGALGRLGEALKRLQLGRTCCVLADNNTYAVAGAAVVEGLEDAGCSVHVLVLEREGELVGDEYSLGEAALGLESGPDFMVALGSGTITDLTRYLSKISKIPFIVIATAPSMDGYVSSVAPLITHGRKQTFMAQAPAAFIADLDIFAGAPDRLIQAGVGDLMGKITAKADWLLSHYLQGEYYCRDSQALVDRAVAMTAANVDGANSRNAAVKERFLDTLTQGLVLTGVAITLVGSSRPASGSEHHISHYWEMKGLQEQHPLPLHGQKVGFATYLILKVYEKVIARIKDEGSSKYDALFAALACGLIGSEKYLALLARIDAMRSYQHLGIPQDWVLGALREAMYVRERYTILRFAAQRQWLDSIADEIMAELD